MGRKITMTGKNAQYIEHRGVNATPDNDREIVMEGEEAVYKEYAYGQASQAQQERSATENAEELPAKSDNDGKGFVADAKAIDKCFKFNSDFVRRSVRTLLADFYQGNNANLALIEITLFHHQQLKRRNSHKLFVMALAAWGIITVANAEELRLIVMGVSDKYKRMPKEGYLEWGDNYKPDRLTCERMSAKLGPSINYWK